MSRLDAYRSRWLTPPEDPPPEPCPHCGDSDREECKCPRELAYPEEQPDELEEDTDNLRAEEREARQEARFAALDRADRSGPTH